MRAFDPQLVRDIVTMPLGNAKLPTYRTAKHISGANLKIVLLVVAVNEGASISGRTVADQASCSPHTAYRALLGLERGGFIRVDGRGRRVGHHTGTKPRRFYVVREKVREVVSRHTLFTEAA